jgi:type III secretion protein V
MSHNPKRSWIRPPEPGAALARHGDILLAGLVVGIVAMMIIPLPTFLLDLLLTTNISISVILLLVCISISDALRIATLPSLLLITTLFRLGLNVSSTRLILLQADAGEVIRSFGEFVVSGNLVVGAVIFLILTLIQFIVIAKGSERVAEVAARFALDAMPGRQMAIDADLRAGAIDLDEARRMRANLKRESQLYGSMDGAMKFVKGDAVAGILITVINIVGGLLIGVLQRGMPLGDALRLYSILTVGDGLVSQIPALLISTGAGIVVTRVASEDEGSPLGKDIGEQVLGQPRAIAIAAGLLVLLSLVPGMPTFPFLVLAVAIGTVAYALRSARGRGDPQERPSEELEPQPETDAALPAAITLEVGDGLTPCIDARSDGGRFRTEIIPGLRELLHTELGVRLPGIRVRGAVRELPPRGYRILLSEIPMASGVIPEESLDPPTQIAIHLGSLLRAYAFEFVGLEEAQQLLDSLERTHPTLVHEVVPKAVSIQTLAEVLRRLVEEGISIRHLREILQALAEWGPVERDPVVLTEHVRVGLRRYISHKFGRDDKTLRAYLLDPAIEDAVRDSIQRTDRGSYLAMEPDLSRDIVGALRRHLESHPKDEPWPAVLTTMEIRRHVRRLFEVDFPEVPVLSFTELLPELQVKPVARVSVTG